MRRVAAVLVVAAFALVGRPAFAQPAVAEQVRNTFEAGNLAYAAERFLDAATAYEEAYRLMPLPAIAFSAAQAHRRQYSVDHDLGHLRRARDLYQLYLTTEPQGARREHAVAHIATIDALLAGVDAPEGIGDSARRPVTQLMVSSRAPGAHARIDGGAPAAIPLLAEVSPGPHRVEVEAPGFFPERETHVAVEGRLVVATLQLRARPATIAVRAPAGATIRIDGRVVGSAPVRPLSLDAGRHTLVATTRGHAPFTRDLVLDRGSRTSVVASLQSTGQRRVSWVVGAAAAASLTAAGITGGLALAAQDRAEGRLEPLDHGQNISASQHARALDDLDLRDDLRATSIGLVAGGVALAVTAALLYLIDTPEPPSP